MITRALEDPALRRGARAMADALAQSDGAVEVAEIVERLGGEPAGAPIARQRLRGAQRAE